MKKCLKKFENYMMNVIADFKEKSSAGELMLLSVRSELIPLLEDVVDKHDLFLCNRYYQTDMDEIRDMRISKIPANIPEEDYY
jgi:hypothetical protein